MKILLIIIIVVLVITIIVGLHIHNFIEKARSEKEVDYLIVLGSKTFGSEPGKHLRMRLDAAIDILRKNPNIITITSGGKGSDEEFEEAEVMKKYILENINDHVTVLAEGNSSSTYENLLLSKKLLMDGDARCGIVTNSYHLFRAVWYAKKVGIKNAVPIYAPSVKEYLLQDVLREIVIIIISHFYYSGERVKNDKS